MNSYLRPAADFVGILGSVLCVLHCLVLPVSLVSGLIGPFAERAGESSHRLLVGVLVPAAVIALSVGFSLHRDRGILVLGTVGLILLITSTFVLHDMVGEAGEGLAGVVAAGLLTSAHLRNGRLCRCGNRAND